MSPVGRRWLALQERPWLLPLLCSVPLYSMSALVLVHDLLIGDESYGIDTETMDGVVEWGAPETWATDGDVQFWLVVAVLVLGTLSWVLIPRLPLVRVDGHGLTVLPWRRVTWRDVESMQRYHTCSANQTCTDDDCADEDRTSCLLITTAKGHVVLTRRNYLRYSADPNVDEEFATVEWYWSNWKSRHEPRELTTQQ